MTFRYVFWGDAMEIKNARDLFRLVFLMFFISGSVLLTDEFARTSSNYLFSLGLFTFSILLSLYINTALQGLQLTAEWANEGDRDGRYWIEHLLVSVVILFSFHAFLHLTFNQDIFGANGSFTESQLMLEFPLAFLIFCSIVLLICYTGFLIAYIVVETVIMASEKQSAKDLLAKEQHNLFRVWQSLNEAEKLQVHPQIMLLEKALHLYHQLPRNEQKKQQVQMMELLENATKEFRDIAKQKNLLR